MFARRFFNCFIFYFRDTLINITTSPPPFYNSYSRSHILIIFSIALIHFLHCIFNRIDTFATWSEDLEVRLSSKAYSNKQIIGIMERLAGYKHNTGIVRRLLFKPQTKTSPRKKQANTQEHNTKKKNSPPPKKKKKQQQKQPPLPKTIKKKKQDNINFWLPDRPSCAYFHAIVWVFYRYISTHLLLVWLPLREVKCNFFARQEHWKIIQTFPLSCSKWFEIRTVFYSI